MKKTDKELLSEYYRKMAKDGWEKRKAKILEKMKSGKPSPKKETKQKDV